jgi:hypothetical protein
MPNPWVSQRCDQFIPVNKAVGAKEWLENRQEIGLPDFSLYNLPKLGEKIK